MKKITIIGLCLIIAAALLAWGCAPGPNGSEKTANAEGKIAGFWMGIWHGLISPITFVISLFTHNVRLYEIHNNGSWYNFGFVIGAGLFLSGGILGRKSRDRRR